MPLQLEHKSSVNSPVTFASTAATTAKLPYGAVGGATAIVTAVSGATTLSWYVGSGTETTLYPAYNASGAITTTIAAGRAYKVPDELFAAPFIAAVTDSGTATVILCVKG
jgi:hypothetical protein